MTTRRIVALALTALVLYGLAPAVLEVFGAFDELDDFEPLWWIVVIGTQIAGLICFFARPEDRAARAPRGSRW